MNGGAREMPPSMSPSGQEPPPEQPAALAPRITTSHTCCVLGMLVGVLLVAVLIAVILIKDDTIETTILRQVHVLISHGERTPNAVELSMLETPPSDHKFAPYGIGAMTNEGKLLVYDMGALLRKRYDKFLGPYYLANESVIVVSDNDLSKMTGLLVAAGLWPPCPVQKWNNSILWQPVPYTYPLKQNDFLLYEENCPRYNQEKQRILAAFIEDGLLLQYKDLFQKIAHLTGTNFSTPRDAYYLNNLFMIQDDIKVANPKWAKHVRRKLMELARLEYTMMFYNNLLRKLSGGAVLQHIIEKAESSIANEHELRIFVRTGTPVTVAALLAACSAAPPRLPDPGAALLFELHERKPIQDADSKQNETTNDRFAFKIYYWDDDLAEPKLMEVPSCSSSCPLETFKELTNYIVSKDYVEDCKLVPNIN